MAAARQVQSRLGIGAEADDLMRRREAEALREAQDRRTALRQEPLASRYAVRQAQPDLEPEARGRRLTAVARALAADSSLAIRPVALPIVHLLTEPNHERGNGLCDSCLRAGGSRRVCH